MRQIISLGAGVQSSTMALMAAHGEITPMPECAIFADTGWEPKAVYAWLEWLETQLPFPVYRVSAGNIRNDQVAKRRTPAKAGRNPKTDRFATLPYYTMARGDEREGRVKRQCTSEYKITPIETFIRRDILKIPFRARNPTTPVITQWRGISIDEASRMKPSREKWMTVRYPLAMELGLTRNDCLLWMQRKSYPQPPRSACIGCPFHSDEEWQRMKTETPDEFADAVEFDVAVRKAGGMRSGDTFLHRTCQPLGNIDFAQRIADKRGPTVDMFGNECEGMCGV